VSLFTFTPIAAPCCRAWGGAAVGVDSEARVCFAGCDKTEVEGFLVYCAVGRGVGILKWAWRSGGGSLHRIEVECPIQ
jgi:hypothetical protein